MAFNSYLTEFAGLPVVEYRSPAGAAAERAAAAESPWRRVEDVMPPTPAETLAAPGAVAWRLADPLGHEVRAGDPTEYYGRFFAAVDPGAVTSLVVGHIPNTLDVTCPEPVYELLLEYAPRLSGLRSLFFGDLTHRDCEVSWLEHGELGPLLEALPGLERFAVWGTRSLSLAVKEHSSLRSLALQGGGLPAELARQVLASRYPALEHLELWLGVDDYGGDTTVADLAPLLDGRVHGGVRSLGLRNAHRTDRWAAAVAGSAILARLEALDLSLGTLTDEGAQVLLDTPGFRELERLDLHYHYMSEEMERRVLDTFTAAGVAVDASDRQVPEPAEEEAAEWEYRYYPSVGE